MLSRAFGPFASMLIFALCTLGLTSSQAGTIYNTPLASPGFYNGTGNANSNFTTDTEGNLELGLSVIQRFVGPINPGSGSNIYPVSTSAGPLASWNFEFSVNTQAGGGTDVLSKYLYGLVVQDISLGTTGPLFDPVRLISDDSGFGPTGKTAGVNLTTQWGAQNSENPAFAGFLPGFNSNNHDLYKVTLLALNQAGGQVGSVSVFADARVATPEPATWGLVGGTLALCFLARKRKALHKIWI